MEIGYECILCPFEYLTMGNALGGGITSSLIGADQQMISELKVGISIHKRWKLLAG